MDIDKFNLPDYGMGSLAFKFDPFDKLAGLDTLQGICGSLDAITKTASEFAFTSRGAGIGDVSVTIDILKGAYCPPLNITGVTHLPELPKVTIVSAVRDVDLLRAPKPIIDLSRLPEAPADGYVNDLEARVDELEAENHAQRAENSALRTENEALTRKICHLKQRLNVPAFRDLVEYTDPDVPPNDLRFCLD